jgi:hypothetical protein
MVKGAVLIKSDPEMRMNTWQWSIVKPTKLRMYDNYSKVKRNFVRLGSIFSKSIKLHIKSQFSFFKFFKFSDFHGCVNHSQFSSLHTHCHNECCHLHKYEEEKVVSRYLCCQHPHPHHHGICLLSQHQNCPQPDGACCCSFGYIYEF